jgi:hypothetical protein
VIVESQERVTPALVGQVTERIRRRFQYRWVGVPAREVNGNVDALVKEHFRAGTELPEHEDRDGALSRRAKASQGGSLVENLTAALLLQLLNGAP